MWCKPKPGTSRTIESLGLLIPHPIIRSHRLKEDLWKVPTANFQVHGKLSSASDYFGFSYYEHFAFDDADGLAEVWRGVFTPEKLPQKPVMTDERWRDLLDKYRTKDARAILRSRKQAFNEL